MADKSLYAQYVEEREGKFVLEHEQGFATYLFHNEYCYIEDIYVVPEARKSAVASKLADKITEIALKNGYKKLLGSVRPSAKNSTSSMKVLLAYGFGLLSSDRDSILLEKVIGV